ncbi:hypothetical protein VTO73DRAFT_686 [Trametes versicolor]
MIIRSTSHGIPSATTLDLLTPHVIRCRKPLQAAARKQSLTTVKGCRRASSTFSQPSIASSSKLTPGTLLARLPEDFPNGSTTRYLTHSQTDALNSTIPTLRAALNKRDFTKARRTWLEMRDSNLVAFLGPSQHDVLSQAVSTLCTSLSLSEKQVALLRDIALVCAVGGSTSGLRALMLSVIKHGQPRVALAIYDQYVHGLRERNIPDGIASKESSAVADEAAVSDEESSATLNHVRDEILVAAIAAHAQLGTFADAMQTYLKAGIRSRTATLAETIRLLHPDRALRAQLNSYVFRLRTAGLLARPPTLMKHLANLTRDTADISLEQLYTTAIAGTSEPDPWLALTPSQLTGTRVVLLPDFFWASFLSSFLACQRTDLAEKLWDDLLKLKVTPSIAIWNALLDGYGRMRSLDATNKTWEVMNAQGVKPDALSHRALISAFFIAGKPHEALGQFRAFESSYLTGGSPADSSGVMAVYNTTLHGLLFHSMEEDAKAIKSKMEESGPSPDIITYNTFIRYYGRKGELKAMGEVLKELERAGVKADVYTFSTLLSSLLKVRPDADKIVLNFMKKHGVLPDTTALTAIIDHQLRECTPQNLKVAMDLMAKMERGEFGDAVPNVITYTSILTAMNRGTWLSRSVVEEYTQQILNTMQTRDLKPNRQTYNVLIKAALVGFEPEGLENAMKYYRDMLRLRVHMNSDTWYILLKGLMDRDRWDVAGEVVKDMRRRHASNLSSSLKKLVDIISRHNANGVAGA